MEEVEVQGPISEMPETILILIMSHLEFDEILRMTRINKMFNRYAKNKTLWELVYNAHDQRYFGGKSISLEIFWLTNVKNNLAWYLRLKTLLPRIFSNL